MKKRVNVMMDERTLAELDRIAEMYSLSRSSAISLAVAKYVQQEQQLSMALSKYMQRKSGLNSGTVQTVN